MQLLTDVRTAIAKSMREHSEYWIVGAACFCSWVLGVINGAMWFN